jgi:hypothetical protein
MEGGGGELEVAELDGDGRRLGRRSGGCEEQESKGESGAHCKFLRKERDACIRYSAQPCWPMTGRPDDLTETPP